MSEFWTFEKITLLKGKLCHNFHYYHSSESDFKHISMRIIVEVKNFV